MGQVYCEKWIFSLEVVTFIRLSKVLKKGCIQSLESGLPRFYVLEPEPTWEPLLCTPHKYFNQQTPGYSPGFATSASDICAHVRQTTCPSAPVSQTWMSSSSAATALLIPLACFLAVRDRGSRGWMSTAIRSSWERIKHLGISSRCI
jgi:hypothetical protein